jgi:hypothetical protein
VSVIRVKEKKNNDKQNSKRFQLLLGETDTYLTYPLHYAASTLGVQHEPTNDNCHGNFFIAWKCGIANNTADLKLCSQSLAAIARRSTADAGKTGRTGFAANFQVKAAEPELSEHPVHSVIGKVAQLVQQSAQHKVS